MKKIICLLILAISVLSETYAQSWVYPDIVYLNNGSMIRCKILEFDLQENIKLEIMGGSIMVYPSADVLKIEKDQAPTREGDLRGTKKATEYDIPEVGNYHVLQYHVMGGLKESRWGGVVATLGIGLKYATGYRFNQYLAVGGGVGWVLMDNYYMASSHIPIFGEIRGELMNKPNSLYYSFGLGYNAALVNKNSSPWGWVNMTKAKGGIYANPALGIRFASRKKMHWNLEFAYSIHTASFEYIDRDGLQFTTKNSMVRPAIGVGIQF